MTEEGKTVQKTQKKKGKERKERKKKEQPEVKQIPEEFQYVCYTKVEVFTQKYITTSWIRVQNKFNKRSRSCKESIKGYCWQKSSEKNEKI